MKSSESPIQIGLVGIVLIGLSVFLIVGNIFTNMGSYVSTMFVKTEMPATFAFQTYDTLLKKFVHESRVDYKSLKSSEELEAALAELRKTSPEKMSEEEQICFWINAYNLLSMKLICDRYPLASYKELGNDPGTKNFIVGGKSISVKEIDEEKLIPYMNHTDWRVLFSRCNGSVGYPNISDHPYQAKSLEEDLRSQMSKFIVRADNWLYDDTLNRLEVTEFYMWNKHYLDGANVTPLMLLNGELPQDQQIDTGAHVVYNLVCQQRINEAKNWSATQSAGAPPVTGTDASQSGQGPAASPPGTGTATSPTAQEQSVKATAGKEQSGASNSEKPGPDESGAKTSDGATETSKASDTNKTSKTSDTGTHDKNAASESAPAKGATKDGTMKNGTTKDSTTKDSTAKDGTARDGNEKPVAPASSPTPDTAKPAKKEAK